jgi:membrane fusion protein, multidrug efflux system
MDQNITTIEQDRSPELTSSVREMGASPLRRWLRWVLLVAGATVALAGAGFYGHYYWTAGRFLVSTDDAYLQADNVIISPKVSGYISDVPVQDNQAVKGSQVVARIDDRDYRTALAVAQANVKAQQGSIQNLIHQMAQQELTVAAVVATVDSDQAALAFSNQEDVRYESLAKTGSGTIQSAQKSAADIHEKQAALAHDTAAVGAARKQFDVLGTQVFQA